MNWCLPYILLCGALLAIRTAPAAPVHTPSQKECDAATEAVLEAKKGSKKKAESEATPPPPDDPQAVRTKLGFVKLPDDEQKYYQDRMERLLRRLYPNHDFTKEPIEFALVDNPAPNAFFTYIDGKPVIGFSAGLLKTAKTADLLAFVMAHEYKHYLIRKEHGPDMANSKLEEGSADVTSIIAMEEAGMDGTVAHDFFPLEAGGSNFWITSIENLSDPHPDNVNRRNIIQATLAKLSVDRGGMNKSRGVKRKALPHELTELGKKYERTKKHSTETTKTKSEKQLKKNMTRHTTDLEEAIKNGDAQGIQSHAAKLFKTFRDLAKIASHEVIEEATLTQIHNSMDVIISNYHAIYSNNPGLTRLSQIYRDACFILDPRHQDGMRAPLIVGDRLRTLDQKMRAFTESASPDEAQRNAKALMEDINSLKGALENLAGGDPPALPVLPSFFFPENAPKFNRAVEDKTPVSWNAFVGWAKNDKSGAILRSLVALGVHDSRLYENLNSDDILRLSRQVKLTASSGLKRYQANPRNTVFGVEVSPEGHVIKFLDTGNDLNLGHDSAQLWAARAALAREAPIALAHAATDGKAGEERFNNYLYLLERSETADLIGLDQMMDHPDLFFKMNRATALNHRRRENIRANAWAEIIEQLETEVEKHPEKAPRAKEIFQRHISGDAFHDARIDVFEYLLRAPAGSFSVRDKLHEMAKSDMDALFIESRNGASNVRRLFGFGKAATQDELRKQLQELNASDSSEKNDEHEAHLKALMSAALLSDFLASHPEVRADDLALTELLGYLPYDLRRWYPRFHEALRTKMKERRKWPNSPQETYDIASELRRLDLFPSGTHLEDRLLSQALAQVDSIKNPQQRRVLVEKLLQSHAAEWPYVRKDMEEAWTAAVMEVANQTGKDRDQTIIDQARDFAKQLNYRDRYSLLEKLAEAAVSQKHLSVELGKMVNEVTTENFSESQRMGGGAEIVTELARRDAQFRHTLLDFLLGRGNSQEQKKVDEALAKSIRVQNLEFSESRVQEEIKNWNRLSPEVRQRRLEIIYEQFWNAPLAGRAVVIKSLLFSDHPDPKIRKGIAESNAIWAIEQLFPKGSDYAAESRKVLLSYFKTLDEEIEMPYFVAAALGAANQFKHDRNATIGKRLAKMLEMMGPAEIKLGQAIHSFDQTPDDIRSGMTMMKTEVDVPPRWELMEHYEKTVPEELRGKIESIGKRLGAASYYYVYEVKMKDGSTRALALLKPNARRRSERGLERMSQLVDELATDPQLSELAPALKELVEQTKAMASIETDAKLSEQQSQLARELYENKNISVNGKIYRFNPARTLELGNGYRLMEKAEGKHFNELPTKTPEEKQHKKEMGLAYHTLELGHLLSGKPFDEDRHGGQMRVTGNSGTLFDFGALKLTPPDPAELQSFGTILRKIHQKMNGEKMDPAEVSKIFVDEMNKYRSSGAPDTGYLVSVHKAWLALSDYRVDLTPQDYKDMLHAVMARGEGAVHEKIMEGYLKDMSFAEKLALMGSAMGAKSPIRFEK